MCARRSNAVLPMLMLAASFPMTKFLPDSLGPSKGCLDRDRRRTSREHPRIHRQDLPSLRASHGAPVVGPHGTDRGIPESGRSVPEYHQPDVREVLESPYRIIYRVHEHRVEILAVVHARRAGPGLEGEGRAT